MAVSYQLADAYTAGGIRGATVQYGTGQTFDILAALVTGGGDSVGRGGQFSVTDVTLIAALDSDPAVKRSGSVSPVAPVVTPSTVGEAMICTADSSGRYPPRPNTSSPVVWIGPAPPSSTQAQDLDMYFSATSIMVV